MTYRELLEAIDEAHRRMAAYAAACDHPFHASPNPALRVKAIIKMRNAEAALYQEIEK